MSILPPAALLCVACFAPPVAAQTAGHWRFEEGAPDAVASGAGSVLDSAAVPAHGTPAGGPAYRADVGPVVLAGGSTPNARSLEFFGADERVHLPSRFLFHDPGDATLEFWIKSPFTGHQSVFWTRPDNADANRFNIYVNGNGTFGFDYRDPGGALHLLVGAAGTGIPIVPNVWNHVAIVRAGDTYSLYVNATLDAQATDIAPALPTVTGWQVSGRDGFIFDGLLDEVRLTAAALDPSQFLVATLENLGGGLAGTAGVPTAGGTGTLKPGDPVSITVGNALPAAMAFLVTGFTRLDAPFKGGTMIPDVNFLLPLATGPTGAVTAYGNWPSGVPSGFALYFQWWIQDPAGPMGFSASNGLKGTTP